MVINYFLWLQGTERDVTALNCNMENLGWILKRTLSLTALTALTLSLTAWLSIGTDYEKLWKLHP